MAADVSSMVRVRKEDGEVERDLVTRDLLGGGGGEVELDPAASLDFLYGQRNCSVPVHHRQIQDLNLPPPSMDEPAALELNLVAPPVAVVDYQSVCTLEKVKWALERASRETRGKQKKQEGLSPSPSSSTTTSSAKRKSIGEEGDESSSGGVGGGGGMMAAGCPRCLMYVLISKSEPRCPRCDSHVPVPAIKKRPRIDLNSAQD